MAAAASSSCRVRFAFRFRQKYQRSPARAARATTAMTMAMAAIAPVERPLWDDEGVGEGEVVADEEEFVVVFVDCWMIVWLKGMRKLKNILLE